MSWRAESTFVKSSALADEEKDFLKNVKKVRDILKLQEKEKNGEKLQQSQIAKISELEALLKDIAVLGGRLPARTEVLERNQDIVQMLPQKAIDVIQKKQGQAQDRAQQDEQRRQRKEEQAREERQKPEFMTRHDRCILRMAVSKTALQASSGKGGGKGYGKGKDDDAPQVHASHGYIYTCSKDKFVLCWSMEKSLLTCVCTYAGHRGAVRAVDTSASHKLISGDSDGKIILWDKDAGRRTPCCVAKPLAIFEDGGNVQVLRWCPFDTDAEGAQRFASACEKLASKPAAIAVWSLKGKIAECLLRLEDLPGKANDLRWAGGAKTKLISCHDNGYIGIWLADAPGSLLKTLKLHSAPIASLCLQSDGKAIVTASHDSSSKVVDISSPATETLMTYKADRPLNAVDVTSNFESGTGGSLVVAGGRDPMLVTTSCLMEDEFEAKILDSESGVPVAAAKGHFGPVHDVVYIPWAGRSGGFATCSEDGCLRVHALDGSTLHSDKIE